MPADLPAEAGPVSLRDHQNDPGVGSRVIAPPAGARARSGPTATAAAAAESLRLGFACLWEKDPQCTWSHLPWNLRAALQGVADTTDLGVQLRPLQRAALQVFHARYSAGRLTSNWGYSRLTYAYLERVLRRELRNSAESGGRGAVLMIQDMAVVSAPCFIYHDVSYDALISAAGSVEAYLALASITAAELARRSERQQAVYDSATGIIAMSRWFANSLVDLSGVPPEKVHVVYPAIAAGPSAQHDAGDREGLAVRLPPVRSSPRRRLLFIGRQNNATDFYRKGGDLVVAALAQLRRHYDPQITLTVVGPETWPLPGAVPDGVCFLGTQQPRSVAALYDSHDLYVMPSRVEPYGLVFAEALSRGLPCVARDACAMPELVIPGISGSLVGSDDVAELAATIAATLTDDALYYRCHERAPEVAAYYTWERAAHEIKQVITTTLRSAP